jgi:hypothetical protein
MEKYLNRVYVGMTDSDVKILKEIKDLDEVRFTNDCIRKAVRFYHRHLKKEKQKSND